MAPDKGPQTRGLTTGVTPIEKGTPDSCAPRRKFDHRVNHLSGAEAETVVRELRPIRFWAVEAISPVRMAG